jgi:hypothetical protein
MTIAFIESTSRRQPPMMGSVGATRAALRCCCGFMDFRKNSSPGLVATVSANSTLESSLTISSGYSDP